MAHVEKYCGRTWTAIIATYAAAFGDVPLPPRPGVGDANRDCAHGGGD